MKINTLNAISPIDGRYRKKTESLSKYFSEESLIQNLSKELPGLCAVEMEGAAVAQVASQEKVPWLIVRVISDEADKSAGQTFSDFLKDYEKYSWSLIEVLLKNQKKAPWINN